MVHNTIGSTVHSIPLNILEHCISTTTRINIRPDRNSNMVLPGYKSSRQYINRWNDALLLSISYHLKVQVEIADTKASNGYFLDNKRPIWN